MGDADENTWGLESIFHFVVNATDFERSLDFYTTLGFRVLRDNRDVVWPSSVAQNFGMPVAQGRGALLAVGDGELHTRLDLIQWLEPTVDPDLHTPPEHQIPRVMALRTRNVQAAYDDLSARGIEFVSTPRSFRRVYDCIDPDTLIAEYRSDAVVVRNDNAYRNRYIGVFRFADGKIAGWKEFHNPEATSVL